MDAEDADKVRVLEEDVVVHKRPQQLSHQLLLLLGHLDWEQRPVAQTRDSLSVTGFEQVIFNQLHFIHFNELFIKNDVSAGL